MYWGVSSQCYAVFPPLQSAVILREEAAHVHLFLMILPIWRICEWFWMGIWCFFASLDVVLYHSKSLLFSHSCFLCLYMFLSCCLCIYDDYFVGVNQFQGPVEDRSALFLCCKHSVVLRLYETLEGCFCFMDFYRLVFKAAGWCLIEWAAGLSEMSQRSETGRPVRCAFPHVHKIIPRPGALLHLHCCDVWANVE